MIKDGIGGGNTITGFIYEAKVDLTTFLNSQNGYEVINTEVYFKNKLIARLFKKHNLYVFLEKEVGVDWKKYISKKLLPDNCICVDENKTVFIIEVKYQEVPGSVDEKLQTCDFKKKEYTKLFSKLNYRVEYYYILNEWFRNDKYKDTLDYIISVGCKYYFDYIPLEELGLPVPI
ncbi:hypothetical protein [Prevotella intermedia]|uniref:hypothetical protein n=1 Tax=Prevotella intermedia TaxID=28131 RepID=UPI00025D6170|nr:hypothetical protein [Prevotella intermedia]AFJ08089.1 hypothetical protein PIN17_A1859 [Prevotella intermedia 17]APW34714.1 hypothetical protein BWX40_07655 [Prevotella intermedia]